MSNPGSITRLLKQLNDDNTVVSEDAASRIFSRYFQRLVRLSISQLSAPIRQRVGGEDVVQSAMASFFMRHQDGQYDLNSRDDLEKLLFDIVVKKARSVARRYSSQKRDIGREAAPSMENGISKSLLEYMDSAEPSPEEIATIRDIIEALPGDELQMVVALKLEGYTDNEIGQKLSYSGETIRLKKLRAAGWLKQQLDA